MKINLRTTICVCVALLLSGCGRGLPGLVPVSGRVQFEGGPPPMAGTVHFLPLTNSNNLPQRPAMGTFGTDGYFEAVSFNGTKGLVPGKYRVRIECFSHLPDPAPGEFEKANLVPADYQPPELIVDAEKGAIDDLIYDVPKKK